MSETKFPQTECEHCGDEYTQGYNGAYCSEVCLLKTKGEGALNQVKTDPTICSSCYGRIKDTSEPSSAESVVVGPPDNGGAHANLTENVLVGFEYPTENAARCIDDNGKDHAERVYRTRWGCKCGNVDPTWEDPALAEIERDQRPARLLARLKELEKKRRDCWVG